MTNTALPRTSTALLATVATLAVGLGAAPPAGAETGSRAKIIAAVSDTTPASGQLFRVSGRLTRDGVAIPGRTVKVQTLRDGSWTDLTGARMTTTSSGRYDLGVVLGQTGARTLRVKAILPGRDARDRFAVTVH